MPKNLSVLAIEDDPEILEAVGIILRSQGYTIRTESSPEPALLEELTSGQYHPDLVLLDILLSGFDGRNICRELKSRPATAHIPVIMFSAYPNAEASARKAGADAFLPKPFGWRELNRALKKVLLDKKIG
jgi:CheY-like chemotaxis protein